jgi:hypothetical protein
MCGYTTSFGLLHGILCRERANDAVKAKFHESRNRMLRAGLRMHPDIDAA